MAEVAIVVRSRNEAGVIGRCLTAVRDQDIGGYEIILVDTESTDDTVPIARRYGARVVPIARSEFTYGRALNAGIDAAGADAEVIVMLSAHAIPTSMSWLRALLEPLRRDPQIAGVYGKQRPVPEHLSNRVVRELARTAYPTCYGDTPFVTRTSHFFSNANGAIRRTCWSASPFDETIAYAEDAKWAKDMLARGWSLAYAPSACVLHSHPDSPLEFFRRCRAEERGSLAVGGERPEMPRFGGYTRRMTTVAMNAARDAVRGRRPIMAALDALFVDAIVTTASYVERRRAARYA